MCYAVYDTLWTAFEADQHHLTSRGRVTSVRRQAFAETNAKLLSIGPLRTNPWHPNEKKIFTQEN